MLSWFSKLKLRVILWSGLLMMRQLYISLFVPLCAYDPVGHKAAIRSNIKLKNQAALTQKMSVPYVHSSIIQ